MDGLLVGRSVVHDLPAAAKLAALVIFVLVVVSTPAGHWAAFAAYAVLILLVAAAAGLGPGVLLRRSLVDTPFLVFAAVMPFVALGERVSVGPVSLSVPGLVGGATLASKATIGIFGAVILATTTSASDLLLALERMRAPRVLTAILGFMVRYASVLTDDVRRMRVARIARGGSGSAAGQLHAVASSAGALFVRSYERGERVHVAMVARGYVDAVPSLAVLRGGVASGGPSGWWCALMPAAALVIAVADRIGAGA